MDNLDSWLGGKQILRNFYSEQSTQNSLFSKRLFLKTEEHVLGHEARHENSGWTEGDVLHLQKLHFLNQGLFCFNIDKIGFPTNNQM